MPTILISGASRGIGLEFASQYAERGWTVLASCRKPAEAERLAALADRHESLSIHELDVTDEDSISALAQKLEETTIDVLLNNAGISGSRDVQSLGVFDFEVGRNVMETNLFGPLRMADAFLEHVAASEQRKIMTLSSTLGSIARTFGGSYFYRTSKAAIDMAMATLAKDTAARGIIVGLLSPGVVATDMTAGQDTPKITPQESVSALIPIIEGFTADMSGQFIRYTGETVPW